MLNAKSSLHVLNPPYLFQPSQILRRAWRELFWKGDRERIVMLPWGSPISVNPQETVGSNVANHGLYEWSVTEALWGLTRKGDLAVDAGANIGYMTSLLAKRVGPTGRVLSFEPQPAVFESLSANIGRWRNGKSGTIVPFDAALSDDEGVASLRCGNWFPTNRGTSWIEDSANPSDEGFKVDVQTKRLDDVVGDGEKVGVLKMDVQGHELKVLQGARGLVEGHRIRDIIFEEEGEFPAKTHTWLKERGYSIFGIGERRRGLVLVKDSSLSGRSWIKEIPNYIATIDPGRAMKLLDGKLWRAFGLFRFLSPDDPN